MAGTPPPIWFSWKKLLADIFFFFECVPEHSPLVKRLNIQCVPRYFSEEGEGADSSWAKYGRAKRATYLHNKNPRIHFAESLYDDLIAIRDTHG